MQDLQRERGKGLRIGSFNWHHKTQVLYKHSPLTGLSRGDRGLIEKLRNRSRSGSWKCWP